MLTLYAGIPPVVPDQPQQILGSLDADISVANLIAHFTPNAQWNKATVQKDELQALIPFDTSYPAYYLW